LSSPDAPQFNPPPSNTEPQPSASIAADSSPPPTFAPEAPAPKSAESPVWTGWDVLQIAFLTIVTLIFLQLVLILSANRFVYRHSSFRAVSQKPMLALLSEFLAYIAVAIYMVALVEGKYHVGFWQAIRWNWSGGAAVKRLGLGVLMVGLDLLGRFLPMPRSVPFDQFFARTTDAYLTTAFAVTLGPLMEELFFRGFLYPVLARRRGVVLGVIFTALPFGLVHLVQYGYAWGAVLVIFLVGVVLTAIRAVTGSVAASFLAHVGYNATLMMLTAAATGGFRHMDRLGLWLAYR
jgi:membrane protease YdiL (CAAX protease family)